MALSVIHFRMHHGNIADQISFSGNGIKLLDLKKEILEKKNISGSLDFDLKITDDSGKGMMSTINCLTNPPPSESCSCKVLVCEDVRGTYCDCRPYHMIDICM